MTINVFNAFEALSIKPGLSNKKIGHRGFAKEGDNLLPPNAGGNVGVHRNEVTRRARPLGRTAKMRPNDLLGIKPRFLVLDGFDAEVRWFVLDGGDL